MPEVVENAAPLAAHRQDVSLESLKNRISLNDMGTRLARNAFQLPSQKPSSQEPGQHSAFDELVSFVFKYFSDLPDDTLAAATESLISIVQDGTLRDDKKKDEIELLLGEKLSNATFNEIHTIASRVQAPLSGPIDETDNIDELLDGLSEDESQASDASVASEAPNAFVAVNDPIRLRSSVTLRPQDIDAHWLESQLQGIDSHCSVNHVLDVLSTSPDIEAALVAEFGVENAALAHLIARNVNVVLWYTRLHRAETGAEREALVNEINERGLSIEALAAREQSEQMDVDLPRTVDLSAVGRAVAVSAVPNLKLPEGSTRFTTESYEQYTVPAIASVKPNWTLKAVSDLPDWASPAFEGMEHLNLVQSRACDVAVGSDDNLLLCAPTGAGKTNVALLALTRCLHQGYKAVYIAPLKALVQEQVRTLRDRLSEHTVAELSGDQSLSRDQLSTADVLVATPEKWDIVSRKPRNTELLRRVGLVIIDEIHLLHDERRGSVIENIVARHTRGLFTPRLVGLSATLPNYTDIGEFLRVPASGLLFFDSSFRPVPLEQKYVGVTAKSPLKIRKAINEACVEKVVDSLNDGKQVLVFVHSRKDTAATAQFLVEHESTSNLLTESQVGVHHAGLNREERAASESGFLSRKLKVLVCTATLAWGVNLPAAVVIIKGTQYYDPSQEGWRQLQSQDVLQMLGRAGRPGFDVSGLGIILTEHRHLSYFASVATMNLPIQSHLVERLCDSLNAEVSFGTVRSLDEAVEWLKRTFWYVRSTKEPVLYGVSGVTLRDVAHSALGKLVDLNAIVYEYLSVRATFQGQVASSFYVSPVSVDLYCRQLKPWLTEIDLLRVFCLSAEFASLPVRRGEESEIKRLSSLVPLPVRDASSSKLAKVCVLTQAYICRLELEGLALSADMVYIAQSASRLFRAIHQLAVVQKWSRLAQVSLRLYIAVDKRQWYAGQTPFRQFPGCPAELIARAEASQLPWKRYFDLDTAHIGEALRLSNSQVVDFAVKYLSWFPRFKLGAKALPLTRTILQLNISISPLFDFHSELFSASEQFYLMLEDQHGTLLEWRTFKLRELLRSTTTPVIAFMPSDVYPPYLFARLLSDKWLHSESSIAVSLRSVLPPAKFSTPFSLSNTVNLLDSPPFTELGPLTTVERALLSLLYRSDVSTYVGQPPGSHSQKMQEMVIMRAHEQGERVLFITPKCGSWVSLLCESLSYRFSVSTEFQEGAEVCVATAAEVERLTRTDSNFEKYLSGFKVIICDDLHRVGDDTGDNPASGWLYEVALTRLRSSVPGARIVGFGLTIATARSLGQWIGAKKGEVANITLASGLEGPSIEVRHWDGSLVLGLRDLNHDFASSASLLLVADNYQTCAELADELAYVGHPDVPVVLKTTSRRERRHSDGQRLMIATIDAVNEDQTLKADKVVLFGTQMTDSTDNADLPVVDMLELVSKATAEVIIYTDKQQYYTTLVHEPLPLESCLAANLIDALAAEISKGSVSDPQGAVDWLASTYLYRRLRHNPSYYGSRDLEEWISDTVEDTFEKLARIGAVELEEDTLAVTPLTPALIASNYGVSVEALVDTKQRIPMSDWQAHTERNLYGTRLLDARVELAGARGDLAMFFMAVDARQSLIQSVPIGASPLLQIPYIDERAALKCQDAGISSVQEFVAIEDDELRSSILGFDNDNPRMLEVADFVNHYPIVDIIKATVSGDVVTVVIERDIEEDEDEVTVAARGLPSELVKREMWYVVVGEAKTKIIFGLRKIQLMKSELRVEVPLANGASQNMTAWLICDSYIDADKEAEVE